MKPSSQSTQDINQLVKFALDGDKRSMEEIVIFIQSKVYNLALRMLQSPPDAEDATQEILIKIVTHLSDFRGESAFTTWVYRISVNYLLNMRRRGAELLQKSFDELGELLQQSLRSGSVRDLEERYDEHLLAEEIKRSCTLGMLICLNRELRLALILGEIFEFKSEEAAKILEITPDAYRKRLSRARTEMVKFVSRQCGLINPEAACRCDKHIHNAIQTKRLDPNNLRYAQISDESSLAQALLVEKAEINSLQRTAALLRSHPTYKVSEQCLNSIKQAIGI